MSVMDLFLQEVIDAHVAIERWLSGQAETNRLPALLQRFSPSFSMIALQGERLDHAGLLALFACGHGARPGLRIVIDELHGIAAWPGGAVVGYREVQTDAASRRTVRRSTVVFELGADGTVVWSHLHETPVAA